MRKKIIVLISFFFVVMSASLSSQTFYRSVADVDSFAYVIMNNKLLVLQKDNANDFSLVNVVNTFQNYRNNKFNSQIIINNYLLVSSIDSIALFSIADRTNPIELHRIYIGNIFLIDKFGENCFVDIYGSQEYLLLRIVQDSLKIINHFLPSSKNSENQEYLSQWCGLSYPLIYIMKSWEGIEIYHYYENTNQFEHVNSIPDPDLCALVCNSTYLFTMKWVNGFPSGYRSVGKYLIQNDTLLFLGNTWGRPSDTGISTPWCINDTYGNFSHLYIANSGVLLGSYGMPGPYNFSTNITQDEYNNPFYIKNSVYRIGQNNFYYLHQLNGMNMTFKEFILLDLYEPELNSWHHSTDAIFKWGSITNAVSYRLQISENSTFISTLTDTTISDSFYIASGLPEGKRIHWRVAINFENGKIEFAKQSNFFTRLYNPDSVQATKLSDNSIRVSWADSSNLEVNYFIMRGEQGGTLNDYVTLGANAETYIDTNIVPGTQYTYGVYCRFGSWRSDTILTSNVTGIDDEEENNFLSFCLSQNYPNPFNPSTKISWQSPVSSHQTLKVYDVLGREVATLVNEYRNAGSYEVEFDGSRLASGVYYYQINAGNFVESRKMVLTK